MGDDFTKGYVVVPNLFAAILTDKVIVAHTALELIAHGVTCRIVEHDGVVTLDGGDAWIAVIGQLDPLHVRLLGGAERQGIVHKRE